MSKYRNQVSKYLKSQNLKVSTSPNYLSFGNYHLSFNEDLEYVTVYNPLVKSYSISIPYCTAHNLITKIRNYFSPRIPVENKYNDAVALINQSFKSAQTAKFHHSLINN